MEEEFTLTSPFPYNDLLEYFSNPKNIMKYVPFFKEIEEIDKNVYIVKIRWIFNIKLKVFKILSKNRITYIVEHKNYPRMIGKLDHIIEPKQGEISTSEIKITFYYRGPFENLVRNQANKLYVLVRDKFGASNKDQTHSSQNEHNDPRPSSTMKTILSGTIDINEIENIVSRAITESQQNEIELIITEGENEIRFLFINGSIAEQSGSIDNLKGRSRFLLRKKE